MDTQWLLTIGLVLALLAGCLVLQRLRLRALEAEARRNGLAMQLPFVPEPAMPLDELALQLDHQRRGSTGLWTPRWGVALSGRVAGRPVLIADHQVPAASASDTRRFWHTLLVWRADRAPDGNGWPAGGELGWMDGWAAWRLRGELTADQLRLLLQHAPQALGRAR